MRIGLAVPAAGLGFSVVIFAANGLVCIGLLAVPHGRSNPWQSSCLPPLACHLLLATSCLPPLACQNLLVSQYVGVTRLTYADRYMTVTGAAYLLGLRARWAATLAYMHLPRLPMAPLRQPLHHEGVLYHLSTRRSISTPRSLARLARLESAEGVKSFELRMEVTNGELRRVELRRVAARRGREAGGEAGGDVTGSWGSVSCPDRKLRNGYVGCLGV